jgi:hypothetical protein
MIAEWRAGSDRTDHPIRQTIRNLIPTLLVGCLVLVPGCSRASGTDDNASASDEWYRQATARIASPSASANALARTWVAPDGRTIVARVILPAEGGQTVTLATPPPDADARPFFEQAVAQAARSGARRIVIPPGTYTFKPPASGSGSPWALRSLSDITIEGKGARLVFSGNAPGILIQDCRRLRISGITIDFALKTTSLGHMVAAPDGIHGILQIDDAASVGPNDGIGHITHFDKRRLAPEPDDLRIYTDGAVYEGNGRYRSMGFGKNSIGKDFLVYHHSYGGAAIKILGDPYSPKQTEDITLDGIWIVRAPGMGITISGVKRGVAIVDSRIAPAPGEPASSEYDAIHAFIPGGDLIITGNTITNPGDDNINLDSPVTPVVAVDPAGTTITARNWSYFFKPGDTLFAFDGDFRILGSARIVAMPPKPSPTGTNDIRIDRAIPGLADGHVLRDVALAGGRAIIADNVLTNGGKVLVQVPNVQVSDNRFIGTGVRVLSNISQFKEGTGGLNVGIANNSFSGGKLAVRYNFPMASAISVYGVNSRAVYSDEPVNQHIAITGNTIRDVPQACISVGSAAHVRIVGNTCLNANTSSPGGNPINVLNVPGAEVSGNKLGTG